MAARIANLVELSGLSLQAACARVVHQELRGSGGVIAVASDGVPSLPFNSGGMLRGILAEDGQIYTGIWDELVPTPAPA